LKTNWFVKNRSIGSKLVLVMLLIALVPLIVSSLIIYRASADLQLTKEINLNKALLENTSRGFQDWILERQSEIEMAAKTDMIRSMKTSVQMPYMKLLKDRQDFFETVVVTRPNGIVAAHTTESNIDKLNLSDRDYFILGMKGEMSISDIIISKATNNRVIAAAAPIKDQNGNIIGVLSGTINLEKAIQMFLKDIHFTDTSSYAILIDNKGKYQFGNNPEFFGKSVKETSASAGLQALLEKKMEGISSSTYLDKGNEYVLVSGTMPALGYTLHFHLSMDSISISAKHMATTVLWMVVISTMIVVLASYMMAGNISKPLKQITRRVRELVEGDLTGSRIIIRNKDEIGELDNHFNVMVETLQAMIGQMSESSRKLADSSQLMHHHAAQSRQSVEQIVCSIRDVAGGASLQARSAEQTATSMKEMASGVEQIAESSSVVSEIALGAAQLVNEGNGTIDKVVSQMRSAQSVVMETSHLIKELGERSESIHSIVGFITNISKQTNLLALNASIEAARAGEHGRGFSVVAQEIRKLAEQSGQASKQISDQIQDIVMSTAKAAEGMDIGVTCVLESKRDIDQVGEWFGTILRHVEEVGVQISEVSAASEQIAAGTEEIHSSMEEIVDIAKQSTERTGVVTEASEVQLGAMEEIEKSAGSLLSLSQEMETLIRKFKYHDQFQKQ
jgi:methyl-accepting chemotaxis protein